MAKKVYFVTSTRKGDTYEMEIEVSHFPQQQYVLLWPAFLLHDACWGGSCGAENCLGLHFFGISETLAEYLLRFFKNSVIVPFLSCYTSTKSLHLKAVLVFGFIYFETNNRWKEQQEG